VELTIEDDGDGFDPESTQTVSGNGLRNMRERASGLNADFSLDAQKGQGTRVRISLPLNSNHD
jgi:signal transduction histidine kinase